MSYTQQAQQQLPQVPVDEYLARQRAPTVEAPFAVDPKYGSITLVTPIGRVGGETLKAARSVAPGKDPTFYARLIMNREACMGSATDPAVEDLMKAIYLVVMHRFPSEQRFDPAIGAMRNYTGWELFSVPEKQGGLWNPLQDGMSIYAKDPSKFGAYYGNWFINASVSATNKQGNSNQPVIFDADGHIADPSLIYVGCYARFTVNVFSYPQPGSTNQTNSRGVGISLKAVQFARHGERMQTYDAATAGRAAFAKAGAIEKDPTAPQGPVGHVPAALPAAGAGHTGPAGFAAPAGFAQPMGAPGQPQAQQPQPGAYQPGPHTPAGAPPAGYPPPVGR